MEIKFKLCAFFHIVEEIKEHDVTSKTLFDMFKQDGERIFGIDE